MPSQQELFDRFLEFEAKSGLLYNSDINWSYCRFDVYHLILQEHGLLMSKKTSINSNLNKFWLALKRFRVIFLLKNPFLLKRGLDFLIVNHERKISSEGKIVCKYTEDVYNLLKKRFNVQLLEFPYLKFGNHLGYNFSSSHLIYEDLITLIVKLRWSVFRIKKNKERIKKLSNQISVEFDIPAKNISYLSNLIQKSHYYSIFRKRLYSQVLKRVKPKVLLVVNAYDERKMALVDSANSLGIRTVELQHGTIGSIHIGYNLKLENKPNWFPSTILTWGKFWSDKILIKKNFKTIPVGFPHLEILKKQYKNVTKEDAICLISQPTITEALCDFAAQLAKSCALEIIIKLHPLEYNQIDKIKTHIGSHSIKIVAGGNLYDILSKCKYIIGSYSTALIEGKELGAIPIILDTLFGSQTFNDLTSENYILKASSLEEVLEIIRSKNMSLSKKSDNLFKNKALLNYDHYLSSIL